MKKIIVFFAILMVVSAGYAESFPDSLSALLECNSENADSVVLSLSSGKTVSVDKDRFFAISDNTVIEKNENPQAIELDGIYIHIYKKDGSYSYAYITKKGEMDEYSAFMSSNPVSNYILNENVYYELENLVNGVKKPERNYSGEIIFLVCTVAFLFAGLIIYNKKS